MNKVSYERWSNIQNINTKQFVCGNCGDKIGAEKGYHNASVTNCVYIYMCPSCGWPTFFDGLGGQYPGPLLGRTISNLPADIESIYKELRENVKNSSYTSTVLLGRKLIMHIAVDIAGAEEGLTFVAYVEHLKKSGHIPPNTEKWLEYMRQMGNEKNHEVKIGTREESERILKFVEMLLIFIYEFPAEFEEK